MIAAVALTEAGWVALTVSGVAAASAILVAMINAWVQTKVLHRKMDDLAASVSTTHGTRPGEYLEMVGELVVRGHDLERKLDEHSELDAERFEELTDRIIDLASHVGAPMFWVEEHGRKSNLGGQTDL